MKRAGFIWIARILWANQQHSSYIPYETLQNGVELSTWFRAHGIRYALVNLNLAAQNNGATRDPEFENGPNFQEEAALRKWYGEGSDTEFYRRPGTSTDGGCDPARIVAEGICGEWLHRAANQSRRGETGGGEWDRRGRMSRSPRRKPLLSEPGPPMSPLPPAPQSPAGFVEGRDGGSAGAVFAVGGSSCQLGSHRRDGISERARRGRARPLYSQSWRPGSCRRGRLRLWIPAAKITNGISRPCTTRGRRCFPRWARRGMRVASILLGLVAIGLIYATVRLLFPEEPILAIVSAGFAALLPTHYRHSVYCQQRRSA